MKVFDPQTGADHSHEHESRLAPTAQMMDEALYWQIIHNSLRQTNNQEEQERYLVAKLTEHAPSDIIGFRLRTDKLLYDTYNSRMWCAGYIMNGGCSDDGFEYFRCWVISRGEETYYKALKNPDSLVNEISDVVEYFDFESFWYVALEAFEAKTGKNLYDYIDYDRFVYGEGKYPAIELTWEEDKPETLKAVCPKLFKKMW